MCLVGIETAAELVTYWTRVASGLCVGGFNMFPQPCSDLCGPATGAALPPTTLTPPEPPLLDPTRLTLGHTGLIY